MPTAPWQKRSESLIHEGLKKTVNIQNRNYMTLTLHICSDELDITPSQHNRVSENDIPPNGVCSN